jgi:hypothetical protein
MRRRRRRLREGNEEVREGVEYKQPVICFQVFQGREFENHRKLKLKIHQ